MGRGGWDRQGLGRLGQVGVGHRLTVRLEYGRAGQRAVCRLGQGWGRAGRKGEGEVWCAGVRRGRVWGMGLAGQESGMCIHSDSWPRISVSLRGDMSQGWGVASASQTELRVAECVRKGNAIALLGATNQNVTAVVRVWTYLRRFLVTHALPSTNHSTECPRSP